MALATAAECITAVSRLGREPLLTRYGVCAIAKSRTLNIERAKHELKYRPVKSVAKGLAEFATHIKETKILSS